MEKKKDAFQPLMNVPFSFIADQEPKTGEGEYGPWFLNLGKVNGVDSKFFTNEDLKFNLGQEYQVVKQQGEGKSYTWIVDGGSKTPPVTQPVQKATTPQSAPKNAGEGQILPSTQSLKDRWITILALLKFVDVKDSVTAKVSQAFQMERLIRRGLEKQKEGGEVTTDFLAELALAPEHEAIEKLFNKEAENLEVPF
jgi:hypothetical protein